MSRILLSPSQVSGGFVIASADPPTVVARIPPNAEGPSYLTVTNNSPGNIMYLKWIPWDGTGQGTVDPVSAAIILYYTQAYTWPNPPRGSRLICKASVNLSVLGVDGIWSVPVDAQLL